jgi:hypothetical protein
VPAALQYDPDVFTVKYHKQQEKKILDFTIFNMKYDHNSTQKLWMSK